MVMFWVLAGLLSAVVVFALWTAKVPFGSAGPGRSEGALAIYKDQLTELDRDVAAGTIAGEEAEAQRTEISRRLLAAGREATSIPATSQRFPNVLVLSVPLLAAALYSEIGGNGLPDVPREQRLAAAETTNDWEALIARVEQQLEKNPDDLQGWQLLAPNYLSMGRYNDAARAMGRIAEISGPTAEIFANMAEALVAENKGLMTERSIAIIAEALKLDGGHPKALYYHGIGLAQEGKTAEAKATFTKLLAAAPPGAKWTASIIDELNKLQPSSTAPKISGEQMEAARELSPEERTSMIRDMVEGLDKKLTLNPDDIAGWLRLIRARTVLNEGEKAQVALSAARTTFATKTDELKALNNLAIELNLK